MIVGDELLLMVPAEAVNVTEAEPLMFTVTGTSNSALLLLRVTVAVPVGVPVNVTVQVAVCPVPRVPGLQLRPDNCAGPGGATRLRVKLCDWPPLAAVICAV